ncbi:MAG: substrate-binding domain-containing protein [Verrucomicrobia bacterium]|nr:substrate-binding domain-containing protein [Verrucomicrobiota bacterium]
MKTLLRLLTLGVLVIGLTPSAALAAGEKIVLSVPNLAFPFFGFMKSKAEDDAKKLGVELTIQDGRGNPLTQSDGLHNALNQGVNGIIVSPSDVNALTPQINELIAAKLPVATIDRTVEGTTEKVPHVGADNVAGGVAMAEYVIKKFPNGARIIFLRGEPGASSAIDRAKGVLDTLKAAGDKYKILADQTANFKRDQAMSVTRALLTSMGNPPDVILASNDEMALGALQALEQAGIPNGKEMVIGYDALPEALAKIRSGELAATIEQSPGKQVSMAMEIVIDFLRNKTPMHDEVIEPFLVDKENLDKAERIGEAK